MTHRSILSFFAFCLSLLTIHNQAAAALITGHVRAGGRGIAGVAVSDGRDVVSTDAAGRYAIDTDKRLGYIFYTLPPGYEPAGERRSSNDPAMWAYLDTSKPDAAETHDFEIKPAGNRRFSLAVIADVHLADQNDDEAQFAEIFMPRLKELVSKSDVPVYTVGLGDLSWDRCWYINNYGPADFRRTLDRQGFPTLFFHVTGNHDNDAGVHEGPDCDFLAAGRFRREMGPTYYSMNLGDIHFVVLDDIKYKNTFNPKRKYDQGVVGNRDYDGGIDPIQAEWLRKDLELVTDKSTPLFVCLHIPVWRTSIDGTHRAYAGMGDESVALSELLKDFADVRILSGHSHANGHTTAPGYPNIHEDNLSALCGTFWRSHEIGGRHLCCDGSPSGYKVYDFDGRSYRSRFEGASECDSLPFRAYDMNVMKRAYSSDSIYAAMLKKYPARMDYAAIGDNMIYVNVFDYQEGTAVTIEEDGRHLAVERIAAEDPLHIVAYDIPLFSKIHKLPTFDSTRNNNHTFAAKASAPGSDITVTVTDPYGRSFSQTLHRPMETIR